MDPALIDLVWTLHKQLGSKKPIHLVCGLPQFGDQCFAQKKGGGQAKRSQHILGKAADIHFPDVPVKLLRNSALVQEHGGVGYYPTSGIPFVHVDTGNVRMWPRIPRLELAALFPDGKTKYLPSDGKPISMADYKLALAKGMVNKTMIASATPVQKAEPDIDVVAEAESDAATETDTPRPMLASLAPPVITEDPREPGTPPGKLVHLCQRRRHVDPRLRPQGGAKARRGTAAQLSGRRGRERAGGRRRPSRRFGLCAVRDRRADDRCVGHL